MENITELQFYRAIETFESKSSRSLRDARIEALNLYYSVKQLIDNFSHQLPSKLVKLLVLTINNTLYLDQELENPQITDGVLSVIYQTIILLYFNKINLQIGIASYLFNQKRQRIFIFPRVPYKENWVYHYGQFESFHGIVPKRFPLQYVQHVVHDLDNLFKILRTLSGKVHLKGSINSDYKGPPLCWFAPLPPSSIDGFNSSCDSLDRTGSRYGNYRLYLPFKILIQRFPHCFILGTRIFNSEHSHTILLTKSHVKTITLLRKQLPIELTKTNLVRELQQQQCISYEWNSYHRHSSKWDQLEFAIATEELPFDPMIDRIRLDFIDHYNKICVPTMKTSAQCPHRWNRQFAIKQFLLKSRQENFDLKTIRCLFSDHVWHELQNSI